MALFFYLLHESIDSKKMVKEDEIKGIALEVLEDNFQIYNLQVISGKSELKIRILLDRLDDPFGTPVVADCERYSKNLAKRLDDLVEMGKFTEDYSLEVSSPGAERELVTVQEWERFKHLPMTLQYEEPDKKLITCIVNYQGHEENVIIWQYAVLKRNKESVKVKKKNVLETIEIQRNQVKKVKLYLDF